MAPPRCTMVLVVLLALDHAGARFIRNVPTPHASMPIARTTALPLVMMNGDGVPSTKEVSDRMSSIVDRLAMLDEVQKKAMAAMSALAKMKEERDLALSDLAATRDELSAAREIRDGALKQAVAACEEREVACKERDVACEERDSALNERDSALGERDGALQEAAEAVEARERAITAKSEMEAAMQLAEARAAEAEQRLSDTVAALEARDRSLAAEAEMEAAMQRAQLPPESRLREIMHYRVKWTDEAPKPQPLPAADDIKDDAVPPPAGSNTKWNSEKFGI